MVQHGLFNFIEDRQKVERWLDCAMVISFCFLIFFLPISIALFESCSAFAIFFFIIKKAVRIYFHMQAVPGNSRHTWLGIIIHGLNPIRSFLNKPIFIFVFVVFLSVLYSHYPKLSVIAFIGKTLQGVYLYFTFIECMKTRQRLKLFFTVYIFSIFLMGINGLYQYFSGVDFIRGTHLAAGRVSSCLRHANGFGAYLILGSSFLFALLRTKGGKFIYKNVVFGLFLIAWVCMGLTYSRGAWGGFFIALIYCGFLQKKMIMPIIVIIIFCFTFTPLLAQVRKVSLISDHVPGSQSAVAAIKARNISVVLSNEVKSIKDTVANCGGSGRLGFWREAWRMIQDFPVLGVGLNNYSMVIHRYKVNWGGYPHNSYLQMTAEIGFLGLFSFLWIIVRLFRNSLGNIKKLEDPLQQAALSGILAGLFGFLVQSFFDTTLYSVQLANLMWLIMGTIVALQNAEG